MKRFLLLALSLTLALVCDTMAKEVSPDEARRIAGGVLGTTTRGGDVVVAWDSTILGTTRGGDAMPTFYVMTPSSGEGFAIVAGDDAIAPLLAYSTTYTAPSAEMLPPNFEGWLRYVDSVVRYAREHNIEGDALTAKLWSEGYQPVGAIMLNTARWSQIAPYNDQCPIDGDARSLTGCTQTAMATIMHHYRWPERATGVTEAYTTYGGLDVPQRDINHTYDWDNMLETYVEGEYSDVEAEAVAVLMADLGHAFKADYAAKETGAFPDMWALYSNFGYSPASSMIMRENYSNEYWHTLLRRELEADCPIFYSGYMEDLSGGHAFVLDGVDDNNYFHVNWGWGGTYDGFFLIDNLLLDTYLLNTDQWAVLGMRPMRSSDVENWLCLLSSGLSVTTTEFETGVPFDINPISIGNYSQLDFVGELRVGVCDGDGVLKSWATESQKFDIPSRYGASSSMMVGLIECEIVAQDRLCLFYRSNGSDNWYRILSFADGATDEIILKYSPIGDTTSMSFDKQTGVLVVDYDDDVKSALYLLGSFVESGVSITKGRMVLDTKQLQRGVAYTIYLERSGVEQKSIMFTLNELM